MGLGRARPRSVMVFVRPSTRATLLGESEGPAAVTSQKGRNTSVPQAIIFGPQRLGGPSASFFHVIGWRAAPRQEACSSTTGAHVLELATGAGACAKRDAMPRRDCTRVGRSGLAPLRPVPLARQAFQVSPVPGWVLCDRHPCPRSAINCHLSWLARGTGELLLRGKRGEGGSA